MVTHDTPGRGAATRRRPLAPAAPAAVLRGLLLGLIALSLISGIAGGLLRTGLPLGDGPWIARSALAHAALMIGGFLGTVIAVERAVALRRRRAFAVPLASCLAALGLLCGLGAAAAWLAVAAALGFVAVNIALLRRQPAVHAHVLLLGALAWLTGNALFALGADTVAVLPWWFAFLVLTIAAERREMTRLMRRRPGSGLALLAIVAALLAGAALSGMPGPAAQGSAAYGAALLALAVWLFCFDIARRTVLTPGLARYMAVCLLGGYAWLAVAGVAWAATALGAAQARDAALHALGLGFVFSMVMGHAPVILPAVAGIKLRFGRAFYLPVLLLHLSLALRLLGGTVDPGLRALGAGLNTAALAWFALTLVGAVSAWRFVPALGAAGAEEIR